MKPEKKYITISDNIAKIKQLLSELVLEPRIKAIKWSFVTKQSPSLKIGYPGQHLASLIAGMEGERTGARGNDLIDGSEVKSCSRIDQLDKCKDCSSGVARVEPTCSKCGSANIDRRDDSKWLFTVRNVDDLQLLVNRVPRVMLLLGDYPNFEKQDFNSLRFQAFEIWPNNPRNHRFREIITNYHDKIYLEHKKNNPNKTPAPKNFWPYSYQFYMCNPISVFSCRILNANTTPMIKIDNYIEPHISRENIGSEIMPVDILSEDEIDLIYNSAEKTEILKALLPEKRSLLTKFASLSFKEKKSLFVGINENLRNYLPLRDTDKISTAKQKYSRIK